MKSWKSFLSGLMMAGLASCGATQENVMTEIRPIARKPLKRV
jgi:hypothetical protein